MSSAVPIGYLDEPAATLDGASWHAVEDDLGPGRIATLDLDAGTIQAVARPDDDGLLIVANRSVDAPAVRRELQRRLRIGAQRMHGFEPDLSPREREVAKLLDGGASVAELADRLRLRPASIRAYSSRARRKARAKGLRVHDALA